MSTRWFSIGVRWLNSGLSAGMRQAGNDFRRMVDSQAADVRRLDGEVRAAAKAETAARRGLRDLEKRHAQEAKTGRQLMAGLRREETDFQNQISELHAKNKALGNGVTKSWRDWSNGLEQAKKKVQALRSEHARLQESIDNAGVRISPKQRQERVSLAAAYAEAKKAEASARKQALALTQAAPVVRSSDDKRARLAPLQERRDAIAAEVDARRVASARDRQKLSQLGMRKSDVRAVVQAAMAKGGQDGVSNEQVQAAMQAAALVGRAKAPFLRNQEGRFRAGARKIWDRLEQQGAASATRRVNAGLAGVQERTGGDTAGARALLQGLDAISRGVVTRIAERTVANVEAGAEKAKISRRMAGIRGEGQTAVEREARAWEQAGRARVSMLAAESRVTKASQAAHESSIQADVQRAKAGLETQRAAKQTEVDLARQRVTTLQGQEPARYGAERTANDEKIRGLRGDLAGVRGAIAKFGEQLGIRASEREKAADAARAGVETLAATTGRLRGEREASAAALRERQAEAQAIRGTRTTIKQHLWGAIYDLTSKFYMLRGAVMGLSRLIDTAAKFHFQASSLSSLLDKRGSGLGIFGDYARTARYQSEVRPTQALQRMSQLAAAGYSGAEIPRGAEAVFNTLVAARGELTEASAFDLGISLDKGFGGKGQGMGSLMDTVVAAANRSSVTVGQYRDALGYAMEASLQTNQTLDETLIAINALMPIVKSPSKAGTVYRGGATSLFKPKGQKLLADLDVMPTRGGQVRPIMDIMIEVQDALDRVQREDVAGTWMSPLDRRKAELQENGRDIRGAMKRNRWQKQLSGPLKDDRLEQVRLQIAEAYNKNNLVEVERLKKEQMSRLNLKRQELEFQLTGQRGGAWGAAIKRLTEMAQSYLRGTIYETGKGELPFEFASAADALKAMRLGLMDTTGEARRMADELRHTSFMLGESFDASMERFKITLGSFLLPVRDAFLNVAKSALDNISRFLSGGTDAGYGIPGGSPAGRNLFGNLAGGAAMLGTGVLAVRTVTSLVGTMRTASALFNTQRLADMARLMSGDSPMSMASAYRETGALPGALARTASWVWKWGGMISLGAAAGMTLVSALNASARAVSDFGDSTRSATQRRTDRTSAGLKLVYEAARKGRLSLDKNGNLVGLNEDERKGYLAGGIITSTAAYRLARGDDPADVMDYAEGRRRDEITHQYKGDELKEQLAQHEATWKDLRAGYFDSASVDVLREQRRAAHKAGNEPRVAAIEELMRAQTAKRFAADNYLPVRGEEMGGPYAAANIDFIKRMKAKDLSEAYKKASWDERVGYETNIGTIRMNQYQEAQGNGWLPSVVGGIGKAGGLLNALFNAGLNRGVLPGHGGEAYDRDGLIKEFGNPAASDYSPDGNYLKAPQTKPFGSPNEAQKLAHDIELANERGFKAGSTELTKVMTRFANWLEKNGFPGQVPGAAAPAQVIGTSPLDRAAPGGRHP